MGIRIPVVIGTGLLSGIQGGGGRARHDVEKERVGEKGNVYPTQVSPRLGNKQIFAHVWRRDTQSATWRKVF